MCVFMCVWNRERGEEEIGRERGKEREREEKGIEIDSIWEFY